MSGVFEAALHVQAMRLVCEALADREHNGIEVDWNVLRQMHDQMNAMLQELQHKHRYDSSEIVDLRKDRDHWRQARQDAIAAGELMKAEIDSLRQRLDAANAAVTLQRAGIELQRRVVDKVRQMLFKPNRDIEYGDINGLRAALAELDAEPAPVAENGQKGGV